MSAAVGAGGGQRAGSMLAVSKWRDRLEAIGTGKAMDIAPAFVQSLNMPSITGWEDGHVWMDCDVDLSYFHPGESLFGGYVAALADYMLAFPIWTFLGDDQGISTSNLRGYRSSGRSALAHCTSTPRS